MINEPPHIIILMLFIFGIKKKYFKGFGTSNILRTTCFIIIYKKDKLNTKEKTTNFFIFFNN